MIVRSNQESDDIYGIAATKEAFFNNLAILQEASGANVNDASNPNGINDPDRVVGTEQALRGGKPIAGQHANNTNVNNRNQNPHENVAGRELPNKMQPLGIPAEEGAGKAYPTDIMPRTNAGDVGLEERMDNQAALHEKILQKRQMQKQMHDSDPLFNLGREVSRNKVESDDSFISRKKKK